MDIYAAPSKDRYLELLKIKRVAKTWIQTQLHVLAGLGKLYKVGTGSGDMCGYLRAVYSNSVRVCAPNTYAIQRNLGNWTAQYWGGKRSFLFCNKKEKQNKITEIFSSLRLFFPARLRFINTIILAYCASFHFTKYFS